MFGFVAVSEYLTNTAATSRSRLFSNASVPHPPYACGEEGTKNEPVKYRRNNSGVGIGVGVRVTVGIGVAVGIAVAVGGTGVAVGTDVAVGTGVKVAVGTSVGVGVGVAQPTPTNAKITNKLQNKTGRDIFLFLARLSAWRAIVTATIDLSRL
jgi:hypothetical protein